MNMLLVSKTQNSVDDDDSQDNGDRDDLKQINNICVVPLTMDIDFNVVENVADKEVTEDNIVIDRETMSETYDDNDYGEVEEGYDVNGVVNAATIQNMVDSIITCINDDIESAAHSVYAPSDTAGLVEDLHDDSDEASLNHNDIFLILIKNLLINLIRNI